MGGFFSIGEQKTRPGNYVRFENAGAAPSAGAVNGICAAAIKANWGPLNTIVDIERTGDIDNLLGSGQSTDVVREMLFGGASKVKAVRVGTGGTKSALTLKDSSTAPGADVVKIEGKFPGTRTFSVSIRDSLNDTNKREALIYENTLLKQKVEFTKGSEEAAALVSAVNEGADGFVTATKIADGNGVLKTVAQQAMTPGTNPEVTNGDYSNAFDVLEAGKWNVLGVDTNEVAVHLLMQGYIDRVIESGKFVMGVVGESTSVAFEQRKTHAAAFNHFALVYVLNGWKDGAGVIYEGYKAAARIAGMVAAISANDSLTHKNISGAVEAVGPLTNSQLEQAILNGALALSVSHSNTVRVESGVNTLVAPDGSMDEGWKKIRRTKTRFELMDRIVATTDPLIGNINNDANGRATVIQAAQGVINSMVAEGKLIPGGIIAEDKNNPAAGESAWFVINVDDLDSAEKMYMTFKFRFKPEA